MLVRKVTGHVDGTSGKRLFSIDARTVTLGETSSDGSEVAGGGETVVVEQEGADLINSNFGTDPSTLTVVGVLNLTVKAAS